MTGPRIKYHSQGEKQIMETVIIGIIRAALESDNKNNENVADSTR